VREFDEVFGGYVGNVFVKGIEFGAEFCDLARVAD
jgi:hypothetical protein